MTKPNFTSINVIIDESGSMQSLATDTVGGFNQFLDEQKAVPGEAIFSLVKFANTVERVADCIPLAEAKHMSTLPVDDGSTIRYTPAGSTALYDAIGTTIDSVGKKLSEMSEEERPSKVLFLIMTDGEENASREYRQAKIKEMIEHQKQKYSWDFVFMGAGIDAMKGGEQIGITRDFTFSFDHTSAATNQTYSTMSRGVSNYRSAGTAASQIFDDATSQEPKEST